MKNHISLWVTISVYLIAVFVVLVFSLKLNDGDFIYALDDPYIHMSMAKNLVNYGAWATNQFDFTSASSSPVWVLLLSLIYLVFGVNSTVPFILNLIFQLITIIALYFILKDLGFTKYILFSLLIFVFITPFPANLFSGMEHSAQIFFGLLCSYAIVKLIISPGDSFAGRKYLLLIFPALTSLRYETIFFVIIICLFLFIRGKTKTGLTILILGLLPLIIYGIISISHGWYFLPNSLLLKSPPPEFSITGILKFVYRGFKNITQPHIFLILIISIVIYFFKYKKEKSLWGNHTILMIAALTTVINMGTIEFHVNGWFYRYDAFVIAISVFAIIINIYDYVPQIFAIVKNINLLLKYALVILVVIVSSPLILRGLTIFEVPYATNNIYDQHYQMSQFVNIYAKDMNVALNDIGMVNYYSTNKIIDLLGLSYIDVARKILKRHYSKDDIDEVTKKENVRLVMCFENWFVEWYGGLPASWTKIGEWTITDFNFVCGNETVSIYSTNKEDEIYLKDKLKEYSVKLPKSVSYKIF